MKGFSRTILCALLTGLMSFQALANKQVSDGKEEAVSAVSRKCQSEASGRGNSFFFDCACVVRDFSDNYESHRSSAVSSARSSGLQTTIDALRAKGKEPPPAILEAHKKELERRSKRKDVKPQTIADRGYSQITNDTTCLSRQRVVTYGEGLCSEAAAMASYGGRSVDCGCAVEKFAADYMAYALEVESNDALIGGNHSIGLLHQATDSCSNEGD